MQVNKEEYLEKIEAGDLIKFYCPDCEAAIRAVVINKTSAPGECTCKKNDFLVNVCIHGEIECGHYQEGFFCTISNYNIYIPQDYEKEYLSFKINLPSLRTQSQRFYLSLIDLRNAVDKLNSKEYRSMMPLINEINKSFYSLIEEINKNENVRN